MKLVLPHAAIALMAAASLFTLPLSPAVAQAQSPVPAATIVAVEGPVTWKAAQEAVYHDAKVGEALYAGAVVRTGPRGNARLTWRNGGDFKLLPLSELALPEDEGVLVNAGKVWAQFKQKLLVPFYFKSPTATAVVRGTILGVELGPDGDTTVAVLEGRVEVTPAKGGATRMLEPGQSLTISPFGGLGPIQPVQPGVQLFERLGPQGGQGPQGPQGPQGGQRPEGGPGGPGGPRPDGGPGGPRPQGGLDWLQRNRASVRLEPARQQERTRAYETQDGLQPRPPHGGRPGGGPGRDNPNGVSPDRAFPAGRPPRGEWAPMPMPTPVCDPALQPQPGNMMNECPPTAPPPPPPGSGQMGAP